LVVGGSTSTTFSGVINNGDGVIGLTKSGAGTLTLIGSNGFTGGAALNAGTLAVGSANALGSSGAISFGGGTLQYSASNTTDYSGRFSNAASQQYAIDTNSQNVTLGSNLTSSGGSFTKLGAGGVTLSGNNSYSAGTLVSQGSLIGSNSTSFGSGAIVLGDGNTGTNSIVLMADTTASTTIANNITVANLGTGLVSIGGTNTGVSSANAWAGTLTLNRNVQVFNDTPHSGGRTSFIGQITGSGGITVTQGRGRVTLQNGTNNFTGPVVVDSGATLQLDVNNGINEVIPNSAAVTVNGLLNFASGGGTETIGSLAGSGTVSSFVAGTYSLVVGGSTSTTFSGLINNGSGVIGLTKSGAGTLLLAGSNTFTGLTSVNDGGLKLNGSIAGAINVAAAATLSGTGTVGGNATIAGTHSPGNSPGIQTFNANLTYEAGAVVNWELIANTTGTAGVNYDQIIVPTGNLTFSGSTTLALSFNLPGSTVDWSDAFWNVNQAWTIYDLSGGATSGISNLLVGGSLLDAQGDALSPTGRGYFTTSLSGQDVMLNFIAVPEPSGWVMAGIGCALSGLMIGRRRSR
jgi:autotransporter-associated beta strand protein